MIRTMIVEDELWERKGIIRMIDWEEHGMELAAEVDNGEAALKVMASGKIDLILTDMNMPIVDGVILLKDAGVTGYSGEIIVISGHTDYDYMKQAISSNVFEYILKPFNKSELNAILRSVCGRIREKEHERDAKKEIEVMLSSSRPLLQENLLNALMDQLPSEEHNAVLKELNKLGILLLEGFFRIIVFAITKEVVQDGNANGRVLVKPMEILERTPHQFKARVIFKNAGSKNEVIVLCWNSEEMGYSSDAMFREYSMQSAVSIMENCNHTVHIGIGECVRKTVNIKESYRQAIDASKYENLIHENNPVFYSDIKDLPSDAASSMFADDRKLIKEMIKCTATDLPDFILKKFKQLKGNRYCRVSFVRKAIMELVVLLEECCTDQNMNFHEMVNGNPMDEISDINSIKALEQWAENLVVRFARGVMSRQQEGTSGNVVEQIKQYINENYMEEIKLIMLAQRYYMNHIYLSRLFRDQTGQNFIDYLTSIRMMKAKELLQNSKLKVKDVAKMVGFDNPYYFAKRYKEFFKHSPSDS